MGRIVYATFGSYFAGSLFVAVLAGLVTLSTGLLLGVPLAPVAALWTTFTNLIPQIGGALGGSFFVLLALTQGPVQAGRSPARCSSSTRTSRTTSSSRPSWAGR